jgi:hypothetical protein
MSFKSQGIFLWEEHLQPDLLDTVSLPYFQILASQIRISDPIFAQRGHREYFLDGLGKLRAAWCGPPQTKHDHACVKGKDKFVDEYKEKRAGGGSVQEKKHFNVQIHAYWWYRSYAQCMSEP